MNVVVAMFGHLNQVQVHSKGDDGSRTKSKNTVHDLQNLSTIKKICFEVTTGTLVPEVSVQENLFFALAHV